MNLEADDFPVKLTDKTSALANTFFEVLGETVH